MDQLVERSRAGARRLDRERRVDDPDTLADLWPEAVVVGDQVAVPATVMRGGSSRGVFFHAGDLPRDPALRDLVVMSVFGSPDARQIDGLGGATPLTSKVAIVSAPSVVGADVDYVFGQVRIDEPSVDYTGNCGNMLAAVGPFAVDERLVACRAPVTTVRIHVVNSSQFVTVHVPTVRRRARTAGSTAIAGVPGTGAPVAIDYGGLGGTLGHGLLPTGRARERLAATGGSFLVSIVDAGNPCVFVPWPELGLEGSLLLEGPLEPELLDLLEAIRAAAARRLRLVASARRASAESPTIPKVYVVDGPRSYTTRTGAPIGAGDVSFVAHGLSMGVPHPALASTAAVCAATAARLPGTVVFELTATGHDTIRIGSPSGIVDVDCAVTPGPPPALERAHVVRTARRLMTGHAYVPTSALCGPRDGSDLPIP